MLGVLCWLPPPDALAFVGALEPADSLPLRGAYYEGFSAKKPLAVYYRR